MIYMKTPFFCFLTVAVHNSTRTDEPSKRHTPAQTWTPRKLIDPLPSFALDVLSRAPAIGAPINDAMEEMPQDMPSRVPRSDKSGQMFAKQDPGSVTRPAEKKPTRDVAVSHVSRS
jgi:hypothetical protein